MSKFRGITEEGYQKEMALFIQKQIHKMDNEALLFLLNNKEGRWFLMRLLDETRIHSKTFTGNSSTFYNEGRRDVGISILQSIAALGLDAVKLKQQAELEYIESQIKAKELAEVDLEKEEI